MTGPAPAPRDQIPTEQPAAAHVVVRPARPRDLPAVAAIEQASFGDPWTPGAFASLVDNAVVHFVVAEAGAGIAGYLVAWFAADEGEIGNLAVAAASRGRGVAAVLLTDGLAEAVRRGAATVYLEVRESNVAARRLYARHGFAELGRRRRYYRNPVEDALVLGRPIAPAAPGGARNETAHRA